MDRQFDPMTQQTYEQLTATVANLPATEAADRIEQFLRDQPANAQAHNDLGVLQYQLGNTLQALARYERAVKLAPQNLTFRKNLASFYYVELGWTDDAIQLYTDMLKEAPADVDVLSALALISRDVGQMQEARTFLQRVTELEPWNRGAQEMLVALDSAKETPEPAAVVAAPVTVACTAEQPNSEMDALLAELKESIAGLTSTAPATSPQPAEEASAPLAANIAELESRLTTDPTNALLHNDLGVLLLEAGDLQQSLSHHEMAHRYAPTNLTFLKNLAGVCACSHDTFDRAIEMLTTSIKEHPADTELLAALGRLSLQCGRPDEALIFFRRILDLEPWNQDASSIVLKLQGELKDFFLNP